MFSTTTTVAFQQGLAPLHSSRGLKANTISQLCHCPTPPPPPFQPNLSAQQGQEFSASSSRSVSCSLPKERTGARLAWSTGEGSLSPTILHEAVEVCLSALWPVSPPTQPCKETDGALTVACHPASSWLSSSCARLWVGGFLLLAVPLMRNRKRQSDPIVSHRSGSGKESGALPRWNQHISPPRAHTSSLQLLMSPLAGGSL